MNNQVDKGDIHRQVASMVEVLKQEDQQRLEDPIVVPVRTVMDLHQDPLVKAKVDKEA